MPTELIIHSCNFYNQLKSGLNFTSPTDPTSNLAGNVGERIKMELEVDVRWYFLTDASNTITVLNITGTTLSMTRTGGSWIADGFAAGDLVGSYQTGYSTIDLTIDAISDLEIQCTILGGSLADGVYPDMSGATTHQNLITWGATALTALIYKFGLIENAETFNILSKVSNNEQAFYVGGINHTSHAVVNMQNVGNYKDWVSGLGDADSVFPCAVNHVTNTGLYNMYQRFKIVHYFVINPFYLEDYINNFEDNTTPALMAGLLSLKYAFECEFRTVLSNPNTSKTARISNNLGAVGWFNENFNGFNNNYSIDSIVYNDTVLLTSCNGLLKGSRTTATITVKKTSGTFNATDPCGIMIALCPESTSYQNTTASNMEKNFIFDEVTMIEGAAPVTTTLNGVIKSAKANIVGTDLVIIAEIEYSAAQQLLMQPDAKFIIGAVIADDTITAGNSDRVTLLVDYTEFIASADIEDLIYVTSGEIFQHFVTDPTATSGTTKADLWNEDGVCLKYNFWLDRNKAAFLNSLKFLVIAYKASDQSYFILDQYAVNLNNVIVSGGIQQINIDELRGYKLNSTDYFNKVKIATGLNVAGKQYYQVYLGQKMSWQSWLSNVDTDTVFYDNAKPQNNLNFKASNYSGLSGYEIKFAILANVGGTNPLGQSGNTDYLVISTDIDVYDYDLPVTWTATIETFNEAGTVNLGGLIRTDANTLFKVTWTRSGAFNVGYNFWAIHRMEESNENGKDIYEFSNIISSIANNKLKEVSGSTLLKVTVTPSSNEVITECLIDYTKLDPTKSYKISARLDDGTSIPYIPLGKITEEDTGKITEDGDTKIIE